MGRAPCCDKASVKKGPWSPEEDSKLKEYIEKHGTGGNWIALPQKAGLKRCGKSCRLRWLNYLRPNIKHGDFSDEEDRIICSLYVNIGSRWSIIAAQLPGRTDNDIKNYWNTKLKKKLMNLLPLSHIKKQPSFPTSSLLQNPLPSSPNSFHQLYGDYSTITTSSFIEPLSLPSSNYLPFYQNQESKMVSAFSPMQCYYPLRDNNNNMLNMFGSEGSCSSSDNGSCTQGREIKQEEIGYNNNNNHSQSYNNDHNFMLSYNSIINDIGAEHVNRYGEKLCFDYEVEGIKQLISGRNFNSPLDESMAEEKGMCYYYNY